MSAEPPIYVVVAQNDEERQRRNGATCVDRDGPLVFEDSDPAAAAAASSSPQPFCTCEKAIDGMPNR